MRRAFPLQKLGHTGPSTRLPGPTPLYPFVPPKITPCIVPPSTHHHIGLHALVVARQPGPRAAQPSLNLVRT